MKLNESMFTPELIEKDPELRVMIRHLEFEPGMKSLELGCTETELSYILQQKGVEAWGVDLKQYPYPLANFIKGDFLKVNLPEDYFDFAIDISALHHFGVGSKLYGGDPDTDSDIKSSKKVWKSLKKDGVWYLAMDRFKTNFIPNIEDFVRQYNYESFMDRVCKGFIVEYMKFYDFKTEEVTRYSIPRLEILFAKLRKEISRERGKPEQDVRARGDKEMRVTCIILTKNEEPRIEDCLKHIRPYVDHILVVDGESTDETVKIAKGYTDRVEVRPFSGSFAEEKNHARTLVPKECGWILWCDADERFDNGFLRNMKEHVEFAEKYQQVCFRFPRVNLPDGKDWPDYQIRLIRNSRDIEWRGKVHEVPYYKPEDIPLDELDKDERERKLGVATVHGYPILHLPRREDERRAWWN